MNAVVRSRGGFTVVEVLISLFILGIILASLFGIMLQTKQDQIRSTADSTRLMLISSLRFSASNALALKRTALTEPKLRKCLCGHSDCVENDLFEMSLLDVAGARIAGIASAPQSYDMLGNRCPVASASCPWEVTTRFKCVGDECGKGNFLSGDPMGYIVYKISLTPLARATRKELAYLRDTEGVPIHFPLKALRVYSAELCP